MVPRDLGGKTQWKLALPWIQDYQVRNELKTKAVQVASGMKQSRIKVPGEKEYMMKGLCYSALSYAPLFLDRVVTVVGDAELALRSAAELQTIAKQVYIVAGNDKHFHTPFGQKLLKSGNVKVLFGYEVQEVKCDEFARRLVLKGPDGESEELETEGTFIEVGLNPNSQMV
jgi:thioredoxin reductase